MAAPSYVPNTLDEQPRKGLPIPPARHWLADRPGEARVELPTGLGFGVPGPDQGYALKLARLLAPALDIVAPESVEDAIAGCVPVALKRASSFGRAPVIHDLDIAFRIWGFLGDAPQELLELRRPLFASAAHHYDQQRAIADASPLETLRLTHQEVASRFLTGWAELLAL